MKREITEKILINNLLKPLAINYEGSFGLNDDTSIIPFNDEFDYVITKDAMREGTHFPENAPAEMVANRLLKSNLSDLASAGATPLYYMLAGSLKASLGYEWYEGFCEALQQIQNEYKISLLGGDTISTQDKLFFSATLIGIVPKGKILLRTNAKEGDDIFVSGEIGGGWVGLQEVREEGAGRRGQGLEVGNKNSVIPAQAGILRTYTEKVEQDSCLRRNDNGVTTKNQRLKTKDQPDKYSNPTPRIELGKSLIGIANSCADVSDGLLRDLENICKASNVTAEIELNKIPFFLPDKFIAEQISGGDDYELVFTVPAEKSIQIQNVAKNLKLNISKIGRVVNMFEQSKINDKSEFVRIYDSEKKQIKFNKFGYEHL